MKSDSKKPTSQTDPKNALVKENALLKTKIAYSIGSLETVSYLLKNGDPEILQRNLDHLKNTVERVLTDLKKNL